MSLRNIIAPRQTVVNSKGEPLAGGFVYLYEPGTTTFITAYTAADLVTPLPQPVRLSGSGRANIWITRDCDMVITDRNGNTVLTEDNANPDALGGEQSGGLVANGSFETVTTPPVPDSWDAVNEAGSTNAADATFSTDGINSYRFTSSGVGGGSLTTSDFFPVNDVDQLRVNFDMFATVATVLNIVRVEWYDVTFVSISNSDVYSSTANPPAWTEFQLVATPPALARFAKLRLIGIDPSVPLAGNTYFDRISVFYPTVVSGIFDNITIQDNEIITTNLNGELDLRPNGTGPVNIQSSGVVDLTDVNNPLNIGESYPPATSAHLAFGEQTIQSKTDATTAAQFDLQPLGGDLRLGQQTGTDDNLTEIWQSGFQRLVVDVYGMTLAGELDGDPAVPDAIETAIFLYSRDQEAYGVIGFDGGTELDFGSYADQGAISLWGMDGVAKHFVFQGFPAAAATMYFDGTASVITTDDGADIQPVPGNSAVFDVITALASGTSNLGLRTASDGVRLTILDTTGEVRLQQTNAAGTLEDIWVNCIRDGLVELRHNNVAVVQTLTAAAGGLQVNNTLTGAGFERVLTASDIGSTGLGDLTDVTLTSPATGSVLYKSAGNWLDTDAVEINPANTVILKYGGIDVLETVPVSGAAYPYVIGSGGAVLNNSTTGNGDSRILTYYDNRMCGKVGSTARSLTTTLAADPDLQWTGLRAGRHSFEFYLMFSRVGGTTNFQFEVDGTNVTGGNLIYTMSTVDNSPQSYSAVAPMGTPRTIAIATNAEVHYMHVVGTVLISTNGGTCEFRWAPTVSQIDSLSVFNGAWGRSSPFRIT